MNPIVRTTIIGTVAEREAKTVNGKNLTEFRVEGLKLRVSAWGDLAGQVPVVGKTVLAEGKMADRSYQTKDTPPQTRTVTEVTASSIVDMGAGGAIDDDDLGF
jgi:single-stranded DNA-binding protein